MQWAVLRNGGVINIVEADSVDHLLAVYPDCTFEPAQQVHWEQFGQSMSGGSAAAPSTKMSKYQFRKRFTLQELVKFDNPELFIEMTPQQKAIARTLQRSFEIAADIDLTDPLLNYGMQLMVEWGLLSSERKQQILDPNYNPGS